MKIHIVSGQLWESGESVIAFVDKEKANNFCTLCNEHNLRFPKEDYKKKIVEQTSKSVSFIVDSVKLENYKKEVKSWETSHPAFGLIDDDKLFEYDYHIEEVELEQ